MNPDMIRRRTVARVAAFAACWPAFATMQTAAAAMMKQLQLVVPTPPGSQPDTLARWLIGPLAQRSSLPGTVVNVPGAAGALAADAVLRAMPETGALLLGGLDHVAYSHLNSSRRGLDPFVDFVPVAAVNRDTWLVVAAAGGPARDLAALARRREPLNYGSNGEGSTAHLLSAKLCKSLDIEAQHIPYRDAWLPDLVAGRLHFALAPTPAVLPHIRAGRLIALASLTNERLELPSDPPAIRDLGFPELVFYGGLFLFAPAALSSHAESLNQWFRAAVFDREVVLQYRDAAIEAAPLDLLQTAASVRERLQLIDAMRLAVFGRSR